MVNVLLIANTIFGVLFLSYRFQSQRRSGIVAVTWILSNLAAIYWMVYSNGGSEPYLGLFGIELPLYTAAPASIAAVFLSLHRLNSSFVKAFGLYLVAATFTLFRFFQGLDALVMGRENQLVLVTYMFVLVVPFQLGLLCPSVHFAGCRESTLRRFFGLDSLSNKSGSRSIVIGSTIFAVIFVIWTMVTKGSIPKPMIYSSLKDFLLYSNLVVTYLVVLDHFIFFALARQVFTLIASSRFPKYLELFIYAFLYATFHWYQFQLSTVILYFMYGLVFGYLYARTHSLSYGIVLMVISYLLFG